MGYDLSRGVGEEEGPKKASSEERVRCEGGGGGLRVIGSGVEEAWRESWEESVREIFGHAIHHKGKNFNLGTVEEGPRVSFRHRRGSTPMEWTGVSQIIDQSKSLRALWDWIK